MFDDQDDLLTVAEVCECMRVGKNRVYKLLADGTLKGIRWGRVHRIPRKSIIEFISKGAGLDVPNE